MSKIEHNFKVDAEGKIIVTTIYKYSDGSGQTTVSQPIDKNEKVAQLVTNNAIYAENIENQKREIAANEALITALNKLIKAELKEKEKAETKP